MKVEYIDLPHIKKAWFLYGLWVGAVITLISLAILLWID